MISKKIKKIYVINLKRCKKRKRHIIQEFSKHKIKNYQFFRATNKDDDEVKRIMNTDFVKKYPPCFRCNKNSCDCTNNVLIKHQIGNWCSYINVMKEIIKNNQQGLIMICEDDIKFTPNGIKTINEMLTPTNFKKYNISMDKPILIRAGRGHCPLHSLKDKPSLSKQGMMSNPCFIINIGYAKSFIDNLKQIDATSDMYIHSRLVKTDTTIQAHSILPIPVYDLSTRKFKKFRSEIHPKGLNKRDKQRDKQHIKKIKHREFLCVGHPRCGTASMSKYLSTMGHEVGHEHMKRNGISSWMLAVDDINYPWGDTNIDRKRFYFAHIIHIVRNPINAIPSIVLENKHSPNNKSYIFRRRHIKRQLNISLPPAKKLINSPELNQIEVAIKTFIYWNKICEQLNPDIVCKIEDLTPIQRFNKRNVKTEQIHHNSSKKYGGVVHRKPSISPQIYEKINKQLLKKLNDFCTKYGYPLLSP